MTTKPKASQEYIDTLKNKCVAWARQNDAINELVWKDFDILLNAFKEKAYAEGKYEAFAWLDKLDYKLRGHSVALKNELLIING